MTPPQEPTPAQLVAQYETQWIDPVQDDQALTKFGLYPQRSRDHGKGELQGSYQVYLPPQYDTEPDRRFPVIYWLHGGMSNSRQGAAAVERIDRAIRSGSMSPHIVVVPQALPIGWYVDSKDGARPVEQTVANDLVQHMDATYRTIAGPWARTVEGFSMGGYGALHLGFKYPKVFAHVSAIAPAVLRDMSLEPDERVANTFFGDQAYYDAVAPWTLLLSNSPEIRNHLKVRLLVGTWDTRLVAAVRDLATDLGKLDVRYELHEIEGVDHEYPEIIDGVGDAYFAFWRD